MVYLAIITVTTRDSHNSVILCVVTAISNFRRLSGKPEKYREALHDVFAHIKKLIFYHFPFQSVDDVTPFPISGCTSLGAAVLLSGNHFPVQPSSPIK